MVGKTYLRYVPGPESGVVASTAALSMDAAVLVPNGAPIVAVPALEHVCLWNSRTSTLVAKLRPDGAPKHRQIEVSSVLLVRDPLVPRGWLLVAGYTSGDVAVWRGRGEDQWTCSLYGLSHKPDSITLSLDVSADGSFFATGGGDTDVSVWDITGEEPLYRLVGHRGAVVGVAFVVDAVVKTLISGAADGLVKVWNLDVQQCVQTLIASDTQVTALRLDSVGSRLFVGVRDDQLKVWNLEGIKKADLLPSSSNNKADEPQPATIAPSGGASSILGEGSCTVAEHGALPRKTNKPPTAVVFSYDKAYVAVVSSKTVELYRVLTAAEVKRKVQRKKKRRDAAAEKATDHVGAPPAQKSHRSEAGSGANADTEAPVAATTPTPGFKRSATEEFQPLRIYHFQEKIRSLVFVPTKGGSSSGGDSTTTLRFATATATNSIDVYDVSVRTKDADALVEEDDAAAAASMTVPLGDLRHRMSIAHLSHASDVRGLQFTANDLSLVSMSADCIRAWGTKNKAVLEDPDVDGVDAAFQEEQRHGHTPCLPPPSKVLSCTGSVAAVASNQFVGGCVLLPGDQHAVLGLDDGRLVLVSLQNSDVAEEVVAHPPTAVTSITPFQGGAGLFSAGKDRRLLKWEVGVKDSKQGAAGAGASRTSTASSNVTLMLAEEVELTDTPLVVRVTPNDKFVAVALQDHNVQLLYVDSMKPFLTLYGHKLPVTAIAFASDSALCATVSMDKNLRFWGMDFGDCHRAIHAHDEYITDVKFVSDTHHVWTCSLDGTVKHWDGDTWTMTQSIRQHQRGVWALAVNSDGTFIATAGVDRCIRTLMRTDEALFPEEEQERMAQAAMDDQMLRDAARQKLAGAEGGGEVAPGGHRTVSAADAGEHLMQAIDIVSVELQRLSESKPAASKKRASTTAEQTDELATASAAERDPALRGRTVWGYLWDALLQIRPSELRHALSSLTSIHIASLLQYLGQCVEHGVVTNYEVAARVLLAVVKPAPGSNTPVALVVGDDVNALGMLDALRASITKGLQQERHRFGRNTAGLTFVQRSMARHDRVVFHDSTKVQGAKRKYHDRALHSTTTSTTPPQR